MTHTNTEKERHLADRRMGGVNEKAWSSINHSIFSAWERGGGRKRSLGTLGKSKKGHGEEERESWIGRI